VFAVETKHNTGMGLQDVTSSRLAVRVGLMLGRYLPPRAGQGLVRFIARAIATFKPVIYHTVRANLRQVVGADAGPAQLDNLTYRLFLHAGQTTYDFFRALDLPADQLARKVPVPGWFLEQVRLETARGRGVLLLGLHMSNFDLGILCLGANNLSMQVLSLANPPTGFLVFNQLRAKTGLELTPITPQSLRAAVRRLRRGGIVLTGADRPIPEDQELIPFFGRPAYLPVGPVRLALLTEALVFLGGCRYDPDQGYQTIIRGPLEMVRSGDREADVVANTCRLAAVMEEEVGRGPEQWLMFHPLWPDNNGV
jgi:phosphatidylinositol dimannoside acyltransferase